MFMVGFHGHLTFSLTNVAFMLDTQMETFAVSGPWQIRMTQCKIVQDYVNTVFVSFGSSCQPSSMLQSSYFSYSLEPGAAKDGKCIRLVDEDRRCSSKAH